MAYLSSQRKAASFGFFVCFLFLKLTNASLCPTPSVLPATPFPPSSRLCSLDRVERWYLRNCHIYSPPTPTPPKVFACSCVVEQWKSFKTLERLGWGLLGMIGPQAQRPSDWTPYEATWFVEPRGEMLFVCGAPGGRDLGCGSPQSQPPCPDPGRSPSQLLGRCISLAAGEPGAP